MTMRVDIVNFLHDTCSELRLSANYHVGRDVYTVHKRGYPIQNFTTEQFYDLPKPVRRQLLRGLLQRGLVHNLGERSVKDSLYTNTQLGLRIV